jgi:uncharacterized protein
VVPFLRRNTNSGAENFFTDDTVVADQRVYHQPRLASRLILPTVR